MVGRLGLTGSHRRSMPDTNDFRGFPRLLRAPSINDGAERSAGTSTEWRQTRNRRAPHPGCFMQLQIFFLTRLRLHTVALFLSWP